MTDIQQLPPDVVEGKYKKYKYFQDVEFDLTDERKLFDWACKQVYIPLGNMMTAGAMMDIDSCPIEGFDRNKVEDVLIADGCYDPKHYGVAVMVAFGYRSLDKEIRPKTRQTAQEVIEWIK